MIRETNYTDRLYSSRNSLLGRSTGGDRWALPSSPSAAAAASMVVALGRSGSLRSRHAALGQVFGSLGCHEAGPRIGINCITTVQITMLVPTRTTHARRPALRRPPPARDFAIVRTRFPVLLGGFSNKL
jgi:hypothetical protein